MTYPPQPGQPYDPSQQPAQPDPYAQGQDPYGQQAPYPPQQPGAYGHTSGAPYGGQQYGQPAPDPYAQQPPTQGFQLQGGQPMYGAPVPQQKSKVGLIAALGGGAALLVILIVVLAIVISGGGPGDVVEDYLAASKDADFTEANSYVCSIDSDTYTDPADFTEDADLAEWKAIVADMEWEILNESEVGDSATVTVKITSSSEGLAGTHTFTLEKIDGDWKVCSSS